MANTKGTVWQIVAYHDTDKINDVVKLNKNLGVVAVGWYYAGDLKNKDLTDENVIKRIQNKLVKHYKSGKNAFSKLSLFKDEMKNGDFVILYKKNNVIGCVGEVDGEYMYDNTNELGSINENGYPHQRKVKWFETPNNFSRTLLPERFTGVGSQGTIHRVGGSVDDWRVELKNIRSENREITGTEVDEPTIKNYLNEFINKNLDDLESGLNLIKREHKVGSGRVDFLAKDKNGNDVLIEVKTTAGSRDIGQLQGYLDTAKTRGIMLASSFKDNYKNAIRPDRNISCYICRSETIKFKKIS